MAVNGLKAWTALNAASVDADSGRKVQTLKFSVPNTRFNSVQLKLTHSELDQGVELGDLSYRVAGLTSFGIKTAKESTNS
jgi:hypothetical protein